MGTKNENSEIKEQIFCQSCGLPITTPDLLHAKISPIEHIEQLVARNQQKACGVIHDSNVMGIWQELGATINLVGSLKTGLLAKHRDIDFHIYTDRLGIADSFAAMTHLAENPITGVLEWMP